MIFKQRMAPASFIVIIILFLTTGLSAGHLYGSEKVPDAVVSVSSGFVIAVDKKKQKLYVFQKNNSFRKVFEAACSTGKNHGRKEISGDAKTPNGIFFVTSIVSNPGPPETYGTMALPLDYPTVTDKKAGRNGTNIWIHGTTKPLLPFQSNGCVVLADKDAHALARYVFVNKTPVIIDETLTWVSQDQSHPAKAELEKMLAAWAKGYADGDINAIDALYLDGYRMKNDRREKLAGALRSVKSINRHFDMTPRDISILHQSNHAVILFDSKSDIAKDGAFQGHFQKLILDKIDGRWFVLDDAGTPVVAASRTETKPASPQAQTSDIAAKESIQRLIKKWSESWQTGNMTVYRGCYAPAFRSQGRNLDDWIAHKINVRRHSGRMTVRISHIAISVHNGTAAATFTQSYSSQLVRSKGAKKLELMKINGEWKIYREGML